MSLGLRLTLVTLSVVTVMGAASLVSLRINRRIQREVEGLDRTSDLAPDPATVLGQSISAEGRWDGGAFAAEELERHPGTRPPKLRGAIERIDRAGGALVLYGRTICVAGKAAPDVLAALEPGQRVEISCKTEADGSWVARKIETEGIKKSDKIKGTITRAERAQGGETRLEIDGLPIRVTKGKTIEFPRGALYRLESSTQMGFVIQESLAAAQELLKERYRERESRARGELDLTDERARIEEAEDRLLDGYQGFVQCLAESRSAEAADRSDPRGVGGARTTDKIALWIEPLEERRARLEEQLERFLALAKVDPDSAEAFFERDLEPYLQSEILPRVQAYGLETEEAFSEEVEAIADRARAAARLELATDGAGLLLALALGLLVSRSISRPILALRDAALEIGHGKLDTRVPVRSRDEIGVLAESFNRMAAELAQTTVKVTDLEQVQEELRRSLAEKELLLRELHHRVKNNLQVISSLLALQSRSLSDPVALSRFQESQDLIQAMVFVHEQLHKSRDVERIDLSAYLRLLTTSLARSHAIPPERIRLRVDVQELGLDMDRGQVCGLIVNELVTNAFKHAFPGGRAGEVRVSCRRTASGDILLEVSDDGRGFAGEVAPNGGASVGLSLVRTLVEQLRGRLSFENRGGAAYRIEFPEAIPEEAA